jgi:TonB family protein
MSDTTTEVVRAPLYGTKRDSPVVGIVLSVLFHFGIVFGAWWMSRNQGPAIDLNAKPIQAKLVRLGEKRDEKLLPRKDPNTPPPEEPKSVPVPTAAPAEPPKQKTKPQTPPKDIKKDLFAAFDKTKPVSKPDKLSGDANGDVNGDTDTASEGERYFGLMSARVKRNYDVSSTIPDAERVRLSATVVIWVDSSGKVLKSDFQQKSGNTLFDGAVLSAVQKASPFPPPPDFLRNQLAHDGVALKFRP